MTARGGSLRKDTGLTTDVPLPPIPEDAIDGDALPPLPDTTPDGSGGDTSGGQIGDPCAGAADCESGICFTLDPGGTSGVCTDYCATNDRCPEGFTCSVWRNAGNDFVTVCVPTSYCFDPDEDGFGEGPGCRGSDCDQGAPEVYNGAPELCDAIDNNCNGQVDEQAVGTLESCETDFPGICQAGRTQCVAGLIVCQGFETPREEVCNSLDDDCNGLVDDNPADIPLWYEDLDGDRFGDPSTALASCTRPDGRIAEAGDCDDTNRAINPTAVELCDTVDNDCDGLIDEGEAIGALSLYADTDGDGFGDPAALVRLCAATEGFVTNNLDCNDDDDDVRPGVDEVCDSIDNNCDGRIDEPSAVDAPTWYRDADEDGFGDPTDSVRTCIAPDGYIAIAGDCNDEDPDIHPDAEEICDLVDNDCNGVVDDGSSPDAGLWYRDADGDTYGDPADSIYACTPPVGRVSRAGDCDDNNDTVYPTAPELCDGLDNNCNTQTDEGVTTRYFRDVDGDTYGNPSVFQDACAAPAGYVVNSGDCNDNEPEAWSGRTETCDGVDNNCNGQTDEGLTTRYYRDADGDGFGSTTVFADACTQPAGYVTNSGDCNDNEPEAWTGRAELCDSIDNNCNGQTDEGVTTTWYRDLDGDRYGNAAISLQACTAPVGYVDNLDDCDDNNDARFPGNEESCDGIDNNCNGQTDEGVSTRYYRDADNDTFGDPSNFRDACGPQVGFVTNAGDCNDAQPQAWTGRAELCDSIDNNCNGQTDEGVTTRYYRDADNDTFGDPGVSVDACGQPSGYVANSGDCNDAQPQAWTGRAELCDGIDNNCNGQTDEGVGNTYYADLDGDTWGGLAVLACSQPPNTVLRGGDCDDNNFSANPGRNELCSTPFDDNCNGTINEGSASDATRWYLDSDNDGQGAYVPDFVPIATVRACTRPPDFCPVLGLCFIERIRYVDNDTDCDDSTNRACVGCGPEVCDGYDNDCNGTRDDGFARPLTLYRDRDGDNVGVTPAIQVCAYPVDDPDGWVTACCDPDDDP